MVYKTHLSLQWEGGSIAARDLECSYIGPFCTLESYFVAPLSVHTSSIALHVQTLWHL